MWLSERRKFLGKCLGGMALASLSLTACGFTPVYGPQGTGDRLQGKITLQAPETRDSYQFNRHFETRMGRPANAPYVLKVKLSTEELDQGATSTGNTTRFKVTGHANYVLSEGKTQLLSGSTSAFTGYSNTGSTVATMASENDAYERLMVILADQVIDDLILSAGNLPE